MFERRYARWRGRASRQQETAALLKGRRQCVLDQCFRSGRKRQFGRRRLANDAPQSDRPCVQRFALSIDTADDREIINLAGNRGQRLAVIALGRLMVETLRNGGFR